MHVNHVTVKYTIFNIKQSIQMCITTIYTGISYYGSGEITYMYLSSKNLSWNILNFTFRYKDVIFFSETSSWDHPQELVVISCSVLYV